MNYMSAIMKEMWKGNNSVSILICIPIFIEIEMLRDSSFWKIYK